MNDHEKFFAILPLELLICGWRIRLSSRSEGSVRVEVLDAVKTRFETPPLIPFIKFSHQGVSRAVQLCCSSDIIGTREELKAFFKSYLIAPIGIRVLTFGSQDFISAQRLCTLAHSFETWRQVSGERTKDGQLRNAVRCNAYLIDDTFRSYSKATLCENRTKNPSGLCRHHQHADVKTLWNFEPFAQTELRVDQFENENHEQAERRRLEVAARPAEIEKERELRKAKWQHVASTLSHTATDLQIFYLLDLGVSPERLNGITKTEASELIRRMLHKLELAHNRELKGK